jgi:hypothetical protein
VLDYVPGRWIRESQVVHDAQLFVLQIHASRFGAGQGGEVALLFSVWHGIRMISTG